MVITSIGLGSAWKRALVWIAFLALLGSQDPLMGADNPIVVENSQLGTSQWQLNQSGFRTADDVNKQIKGYASASSVNAGEPITFYVTVTPAQTYTINIYRMGWYQGLGGRLMQQVGPLAGGQQPSCPTNASTGFTECGWSPGYTLTVPSNWTSGIYLALLTNSQNYQNYVMFVVRDDSHSSALLYQQSITTDQAYNNYPDDNTTGKSLYDYNSYGAKTLTGSTRAVKVSFDRPYSGHGAGLFLRWEIYTVQWLERSGYDISYSTDVDTHSNGARLLNHKGFLSVGHDEYWSKGMRDSVEQARDLGVNLAFFSANSVYWQVRFEASPSTGVADRVLVGYKSRSLDPVQGPTTTVQWRDSFLNRPEQTLIGILSTAQISNDIEQTAPYVVTNSAHWVYEGTGVRDGDSIPRIVGYETDRQDSHYPLPASINGTYALLSKSPISTIGGGVDYSNASIYQAPSGAWVFGAGTISWGWGLGRAGIADARIQQMTANILSKFIGNINGPTNLNAIAVSTTQINLSWVDNSTDETNFVVERSLTSGFSSVTSITLPADQTTLSDTNLSAATTYYYRVKATNATGSLPYSNVSNATTFGQPSAPQAPTNLTSSKAGNKKRPAATLRWTDSSNNETSFVIERSTDNVNFDVLVTTGADTTTYRDNSVSHQLYYYRVKARNSVGDSNYSNVTSVSP